MLTKPKFILITCFIFLICLLRWLLLVWPNYSSQAVVFCDVGQGDATLIIDRDFQMLVDGGPDSSVLRCLKRHIPVFDTTIDVLLLTHADSDHFAGLTSVLRQYQVNRLIINNVAKDSPDFYAFYTQVMSEIANSGMRVQFVDMGNRFCLTGSICFTVVSNFNELIPENIFATRKDFARLSDIIHNYIPKSYDYNDGSIVIILDFDEKKFILTGDAEEKAELAIVQAGLLTDVDVLKVGHHGSKTSTSEEFVSKLQPEHAVISCGQGNSYGHPHQNTLDTLREHLVKIWRTDQQGEIMYKQLLPGQWHWQTEKSSHQ